MAPALALCLACGQSPTAPVARIDPIPVQSPTPPVPYAKGVYDGPAILQKDDGREYTAPRPTILVFAVDAVTTLQPNQRYADVAYQLIPQGWLAVSLDLPAHGSDVRAGEPSNALAAWAQRLGRGENLVSDFTARVSLVLDGLIRAQLTDPQRIVVMGVSRGGFLALHCAAADARVRAAIGVVPVTDLRALSEFAGLHADPLVMSLRVQELIPALRLPVLLETPEIDTRVNAELTKQFAADLRAAGQSVVLHIEPGNAHTVPPMAVIEAIVTWVTMLVP